MSKRKFTSPLPSSGFEVRKGRAVLRATERPMGEDWAVAIFDAMSTCRIWIHDACLMAGMDDYKRELKRYATMLANHGWDVEWVDTSHNRIQQMAISVEWPRRWAPVDRDRREELQQLRLDNAMNARGAES